MSESMCYQNNAFKGDLLETRSHIPAFLEEKLRKYLPRYGGSHKYGGLGGDTP